MAIGFFALLMTVADYLSLHDIWHDYVCKRVIETYGSCTALNLPEWSEAKSEWRMVNISGLIRAIYFIFSLATFVICLKAQQKKTQKK
jgi:hypothetical protein